MLEKIRCSPMHPLYGALSASAGYMCCFGCSTVYICASLLRNLAVPQDFYSLAVSLWNDLADSVFDGVGLVGFKSRANAFYWPRSLFIFYCFPCLFVLSLGSYCGAGVIGLIGCKLLSPSLALPTFF